MLISLIFFRFLSFYVLFFSCSCDANVLNEAKNPFQKREVTESNELLESKFQKIEEILENLQNFSTTIEFEQKKQNEFYSTKIIGLEFTLNHILAKVTYMSDHLNKEEASNNETHPLSASATEKENDVTALRNVDLIKNDLTLRLNNILRHIQNIEMDNCDKERSTSQSNPSPPHQNGKKKPKGKDEKLGHALVLSTCDCQNHTQHENARRIEQFLRKLDSQANTGVSTKDFKQLQSLAKRSDKNLDSILGIVTQTDERLSDWIDKDTTSLERITDYCQSVSGELLTFTESSDLLLKRIESIVSNINERFLDFRGTKDNTKPFDQDNGKAFNESEKNVSVDNFPDKQLKNNTDGVLNISKQPEKTDCHDLIGNEYHDGIYKFGVPELNEGNRDFNTRYCAFPTSGPGWTVIQNRGPFEVQENFNRSWNDYRDGFGQLSKDFWFGNEFIHRLTYRDNYELLIQLEDFNDTKPWLVYSLFRLDSERYNYNLLIDGYKGLLVDSLFYNNMLDFSTFDRRNDKTVDACCACAQSYGSGWWFNNCTKANLNGIYRTEPTGHNYVGIIWENWHGDYSLKRSRMLIRPKQIDDVNMEENEDKEYYDTNDTASNEFAEDP